MEMTFTRGEVLTLHDGSLVHALQCTGKYCKDATVDEIVCTSQGGEPMQWRCEATIEGGYELDDVDMVCADEHKFIDCRLTFKLTYPDEESNYLIQKVAGLVILAALLVSVAFVAGKQHEKKIQNKAE